MVQARLEGKRVSVSPQRRSLGLEKSPSHGHEQHQRSGSVDISNSQLGLTASKLHGNTSSLLERSPNRAHRSPNPHGSASPLHRESAARVDGRQSSTIVHSGTGQFENGQYLMKNASVEGLQSKSNLKKQTSSQLKAFDHSPQFYAGA